MRLVSWSWHSSAAAACAAVPLQVPHTPEGDGSYAVTCSALPTRGGAVPDQHLCQAWGDGGVSAGSAFRIVMRVAVAWRRQRPQHARSRARRARAQQHTERRGGGRAALVSRIG